jgi:fatty acid desaturase
MSTRDYSVSGPNSKLAVEQGLAAAEWYHTEVPRKRMKSLMKRKDGPAIRDTVCWFGLLALFGFGACWFWGTWWCVPFFVCYGVLYGSASISRWHEFGHGTAFRTPWLSDALYQVASFMQSFEATRYRWSHVRHHTDTIIVGRDREIEAMRPPHIPRIMANFFGLPVLLDTWKSVALHTVGRVSDEDRELIPESEYHKMFREARAWVAVMALVVAASIYFGTILPLLLIGPVPLIYGRWLGHLFDLTQHAGLADNVLDHRLNTRTVYMNPVFRFIYLNMNYHIEHHMFPMVPYHALPALHKELQHDLPAPCKNTYVAFREIVPAVLRQRRDPTYAIKRELPPGAKPFRPELHDVPDPVPGPRVPASVAELDNR